MDTGSYVVRATDCRTGRITRPVYSLAEISCPTRRTETSQGAKYPVDGEFAQRLLEKRLLRAAIWRVRYWQAQCLQHSCAYLAWTTFLLLVSLDSFLFLALTPYNASQAI